jgi:integrase
MKFTVIHNRHKRDPNNKQSVVIRFYNSETKQEYYQVIPEVTVFEKDWDAKNIQVKRSEPQSASFNGIIQKYLTICNDGALKARNEGRKFDKDSFFNLFKRSDNFDFKAFYHLLSKKLSKNTVSKYLKVAKAIWNKGKTFEMTTRNENPFNTIQMGFKSEEREYLNASDLLKLEALFSQSLDEEARILDMFLFSCYTGLRFGDLSMLSRESFINTDNELFLKITAQKTGKAIKLPLHKLFKNEGDADQSRPVQIYMKYKSDFDHNLKPFKLSQQYYNRSIKLMAAKVGILKKVTSHTGRHTFGRIMAMRVPLPVVQYLMQHADIKTTIIYARASNEEAEFALDKVKW